VAGYFYRYVHYRANNKFNEPVFVFYRLGYVDHICTYGTILLLPDAYGREVYAAKHLRAILVG